ncbi:MAG TPA: asparagine synthase (glutamine-hydrolyzing) [Syntrophales bacterium]|nr:asparagine synthase (glutamine-hydrolyzing) [Syntrophales bacterium]
MCGICGIVGPGADPAIIRRMNMSLAHRGPDGEGIYQGEGVLLGHRRLSIIDLVTGKQPMTNEDRTICVVFNGEIYNFQDLRRELEERGHRFATRSDTEVLIHGYEEYGPEFLSRLDGIFAFALWDEREKRLLLVRDYFGIKPLHYHFDGRTLLFASEIKAILQDPSVLKEPDYQSIHYFFNLRFIPGDGTLFNGIKRLLPAHYMMYENGAISTHRYFNLKRLADIPADEDHCADGIRHYLREAVRKQIISDVPLGVYLSGGLDSSALVRYMSEIVSEPVRTFSMGFNEPTDELEDASIIAAQFKTDHHEISVSPDPLRQYPEVIWHAEEPKENILQGFLLSRFAKNYVKVCLSGLGGDELFAGYAFHRYIYPASFIYPAVPSSLDSLIFRPLSRFIFSVENASGSLSLDEYRRGVQMLLSLGDPARYYLILRNVWDFDEKAYRNIYGPVLLSQNLKKTRTQFDDFFSLNNRSVLDKVLWAEFNTKMQEDFLMNEDRTSMANGLEVRVPFLDRDLVQFAMSIPAELKMKGNRLKNLFRKAMGGELPEYTLRKKKWGFSFNPYYQFQKDLKTVAESVLTRRRVEERGILNYDYLKRIMDHPAHPRLRWHYFFLWLALGMEIWFRMFIEGDLSGPVFELEHYLQSGGRVNAL